MAELAAKLTRICSTFIYRLKENHNEKTGGDPKEGIEAISKEGINAHFYVSPKTTHEWQSWRRSLHEFAQLLFKD